MPYPSPPVCRNWDVKPKSKFNYFVETFVRIGSNKRDSFATFTHA